MPLSDFRPQKKNANKHTQRGRGMLENSVRKDGYSGEAMVSAADGELFIGSHRMEISTEVFGPDVEPIIVESDGTRPVIVKRVDIPNADDPRAVRLGIGSNRIASISLEYDADVLADILEDDAQALDDFFNERELVDMKLLEPESADAEPQIDRAEELREKWGVQTGDLFRIGDHRLICGDCTDKAVVDRVMGVEKADLYITDPPYAVDYGAKNRALQTIARSNRLEDDIDGDELDTNTAAETIWKPAFKNAFDFSRNGAVCYCFSPQGGDMMMMMMMIRAEWNKRLHQLIWRKNSPTFSMGRLDYQYQHEPILYTWKGTNHSFYGTSARSVIDVDRPSKSKDHPTMKPVELFEILIGNSTKHSDIVLDTFSGSGTTIVSCENLSRLARCVEKEPKWCATTLERMATAFPHLEIERIE